VGILHQKWAHSWAILFPSPNRHILSKVFSLATYGTAKHSSQTARVAGDHAIAMIRTDEIKWPLAFRASAAYYTLDRSANSSRGP